MVQISNGRSKTVPLVGNGLTCACSYVRLYVTMLLCESASIKGSMFLSNELCLTVLLRTAMNYYEVNNNQQVAE